MGKDPGHAFISYVREDSAKVDWLQEVLEEADIAVWRDTADLWPGQDWRAKIREAITRDALVFLACFSSHSLARKKTYQNEELVLAVDQLRLRHPGDVWLIPVRFDDCDVPNLDLGGGRTLASIQRADLFSVDRDLAVQRLVESILRLLGDRLQSPGNASATTQAPSQPGDVEGEHDIAKLFQSWPGVPQTQDDLDRIVSERPPYWEYLLFAGALRLKMEQLEPRYDDYLLGYAPRSGAIIHERDFAEYVIVQLTELKVVAETFIRLCASKAIERAFGPQGAPGDAPRILHLANRHISVYEELLCWAERLRGASVPDRYHRLVDVLLEHPRQPIEELRRFVRSYAERTEELPDLAQNGQPIYIQHKITWEIPDSTSAALSREMARLRNPG